MFQIYLNSNNTKYIVVNIYNLFLSNYNKTIDKNNLLTIKQFLYIQNKSIIWKKFNLYFFWIDSFDSRQYLLLKNLLSIICEVNILLKFSQEIITRDYQNT